MRRRSGYAAMALVLVIAAVLMGMWSARSNAPEEEKLAQSGAGSQIYWVQPDGSWATATGPSVIVEWDFDTPEPLDLPTFTPRAATLEPMIVTPPAWYPSHISELDEPGEIAQFVHNLVGSDMEWAEWHAKLTTRADITAMQYGPFALATPDLSGTPDPARAVWIVGFRSVHPFPLGRLEGVMGMQYSPEGRPGGGAYHYEAYVLLHRDGNVLGVGTIDGPTEDGTPVPNGAWSVASIESLREVPGN